MICIHLHGVLLKNCGNSNSPTCIMRRDHQVFVLKRCLEPCPRLIESGDHKPWEVGWFAAFCCGFYKPNFGNWWVEMEIGICLVQRWLFSQKKSGMEERGGGVVLDRMSLQTNRSLLLCLLCCVSRLRVHLRPFRRFIVDTIAHFAMETAPDTLLSKRHGHFYEDLAFEIQIHHTCLTRIKDPSPCRFWTNSDSLILYAMYPYTMCLFYTYDLYLVYMVHSTVWYIQNNVYVYIYIHMLHIHIHTHVYIYIYIHICIDHRVWLQSESGWDSFLTRRSSLRAAPVGFTSTWNFPKKAIQSWSPNWWCMLSGKPWMHFVRKFWEWQWILKTCWNWSLQLQRSSLDMS